MAVHPWIYPVAVATASGALGRLLTPCIVAAQGSDREVRPDWLVRGCGHSRQIFQPSGHAVATPCGWTKDEWIASLPRGRLYQTTRPQRLRGYGLHIHCLYPWRLSSPSSTDEILIMSQPTMRITIMISPPIFSLSDAVENDNCPTITLTQRHYSIRNLSRCTPGLHSSNLRLATIRHNFFLR